MSESGGMSVNRLTAGGQNVATDVKGNITTLPVNLRPAGSTTAMNLNWDSDNKLRSADIDANGTADVNFQYDALGRRVARSGTGGSVVYVQMDQQTIADYPVGGAATTPTFRYVYASYIDEPVVRKTAGTGGTLVYFHRNQQYSVTAITTSTGAIAERYAYSAYGQPTILDPSGITLPTSNFSIRTSYTGREWDATLGLHHFRARWMSPNAGRFLGRDPIGYEDGVSLYQLNVNLSSLDPEGLAELDADPSSSKNAPWCYHDFPTSARTIIQGDTDVSPVTSFVKCRCVCCSDGYCNGTVKKGPLCTVVVRPVIRISTGRTWDKELVYGHEQYHIDNILKEARNIAQKLTALESSICTSEKDCEIKAKELENEGNSWLDIAVAAESHPRQRPGRHPFPGTPYPPKHRMPDEPQSTCAPASEPKPFEEPKDCLLRKLNVKSQHRLPR